MTWFATPTCAILLAITGRGMPDPGPVIAYVPRLDVQDGHERVTVVGPDGLPLAGATVQVSEFRPSDRELSDEEKAETETTTNAEGVAILPVLGRGGVARVRVEADGYGVQYQEFAPRTVQKRIVLRPVAPLRVRMVGDDPSMAQGWAIRASTFHRENPNSDGESIGDAEAVVDEKGRAEFPTIAVGDLNLWIDYPDDGEYLPEFPSRMAVEIGVENQVDIPVQRAKKLIGRVVDAESGDPIPGVKVGLTRPGENSITTATTGPEGRYQFLSLAGQARPWLMEIPPTHRRIIPGLPDALTVPEAEFVVEIPTVELPRSGPPRIGLARDEEGRPVKGASVEVRWTHQESDGLGYFSESTVKTDADGRFEVRGPLPGDPAEMTAKSGDLSTDGLTSATTDPETPLILTLHPMTSVAVDGQVVDPAGTPIPGASILVHDHEEPEPGQVRGLGMVDFRDGATLRTDEDGRYRLPPELPRSQRTYRVEASADGFLPAETVYIAPGAGETLEMPTLTLRPASGLREVSGLVVDDSGSPIADARVFQSGDGPTRTETRTDGEGRFRLGGIYNDPAPIFAVAEGRQLGGAIAGKDSGPITISLASDSRVLRVVPSRTSEPMTRSDERKLGIKLLEPIVEGLGRAAFDRYGNEIADLQTRLDPDWAFSRIETRINLKTSNTTLQEALGRYEDDPERAIATIEAIRDPYSRAIGLRDLADFAVRTGSGDPRKLLDRVVVLARDVVDPGTRLDLISTVADRLIALGDLDTAEVLLREGLTILKEFPADRGSQPLESFAVSLAAINLPTTRAILVREHNQRNPPPPFPVELETSLLKAAARAASRDPAGAEAIVGGLKPDVPIQDSEGMILRVALAMARTDLPRARGFLKRNPVPARGRGEREQHSNGNREPIGLGLLAGVVADDDPVAARDLLDEAYTMLEDWTERPEFGMVSALVMADLLPIVAWVEPDRLRDRLWLVASTRTTYREQPGPYDRRTDADRLTALARMAASLAPYDRELAEAVFAPVPKLLPSLVTDLYWAHHNLPFDFFRDVAAAEPTAIPGLIAALPEQGRGESGPTADTDLNLPKMAALAAAKALSVPIGARRRVPGFAESQVDPFLLYLLRGDRAD